MQFGDHASRIVILDFDTLKIIKSLPTASKVGLWSTLSWSADGNEVVHAAGHGLQAIDVRTDREVFNAGPTTGLAPGAAVYSANGRYLIEAQGRKSNVLRLWDQAHQQLYRTVDGEFNAIAVSADSQIMAATTMGRTLVWRLDPKHP